MPKTYTMEEQIAIRDKANAIVAKFDAEKAARAAVSKAEKKLQRAEDAVRKAERELSAARRALRELELS